MSFHHIQSLCTLGTVISIYVDSSNAQ